MIQQLGESQCSMIAVDHGDGEKKWPIFSRLGELNVADGRLMCCVWVYRNETGDSHRLKHATVDRLLQTVVGKQHSLGSLQPSSQRRMGRQRSMPSTAEVSWADSTGDGGANSKVTVSKSSSCRSAIGPRPTNNLTTQITIDVAEVDDYNDVTIASSSAAATRRSVVRNSSVCSSKQMLDVYYNTDIRLAYSLTDSVTMSIPC